MTSSGMIAEGRSTSIVPVASSMSVASAASGGAVQESALVTQAAAESGTVASTYTVAGDLSMKSVLISVSEPVPPIAFSRSCLRPCVVFLVSNIDHCWDQGIFTSSHARAVFF